jgi:rhodanese-related sulfurtransferase
MKKGWILLGALLSISFGSDAQIDSKAYATMLDALYKKTVPLMSVATLQKQPDAILLDTRTKEEYNVSHLPGAKWVGYDEFELNRVADVPKDGNIVVYCSVGYRSEKVGEKLLAAGYQHVHNLYGSLFEWVNEGNPVVDGKGKQTQRVHAYSRLWGVWLKRGEKVYE